MVLVQDPMLVSESFNRKEDFVFVDWGLVAVQRA